MSPVSRRSTLPHRALLGLVAIAAALTLSSCYHVALFGDAPYGSERVPAYLRMIEAINDDTVAFSTHVGDIQDGSALCTNATVDQNVGWFDTFDEPLVYTPGDNEWADCSNPQSRLDQLRQRVFRGTGATSRGATTRGLLSQNGYPENAIWTEGAVTYATVHVVGSEDGEALPGWQARRDADISWLHLAFAISKNRQDDGIVILGHAGLRWGQAEGAKGAYESLFLALRSETLAYGRRVLYVHGDGHGFVDDRPMKTSSGQAVSKFRRLQVPGGRDTVRWVRLTVVDDSNDPFRISLPPPP